ncbi:Uncharacterized protein FWK35_00007375, partial [Aphis craccivora]
TVTLIILLYYVGNSENFENNNCDLPFTSISIHAIQFMEIPDTEISECNTTPIEEISNFSGLNDLDISDIKYRIFYYYLHTVYNNNKLENRSLRIIIRDSSLVYFDQILMVDHTTLLVITIEPHRQNCSSLNIHNTVSIHQRQQSFNYFAVKNQNCTYYCLIRHKLRSKRTIKTVMHKSRYTNSLEYSQNREFIRTMSICTEVRHKKYTQCMVRWGRLFFGVLTHPRLIQCNDLPAEFSKIKYPILIFIKKIVCKFQEFCLTVVPNNLLIYKNKKKNDFA